MSDSIVPKSVDVFVLLSELLHISEEIEVIIPRSEWLLTAEVVFIRDEALILRLVKI